MGQNLHEFALRLKALFMKRRMDHDMADELAFHQAMLKEKLIRQGVAPVDAEGEMRRRFGRPSRWHERLRELWQFRRLENLARDMSFSVRVLRKSPSFTIIAILTLALGVGANTTVFSVINGLLLRPLAVPASDQLVVIGTNDSTPHVNYSLSEPMFRGLERRRQVFSDVFAFNHSKLQVKHGAGTENVQGQIVSGDFFPALQTPPLLGRTLTPADDVKGGNPTGFGVVIAEGFWQRWFNRAPDVVGQKLEIDGTLFTVVGVMPKRFIGADPLDRPEMFIPLSTEPLIHGTTRSLTAAGFHAWWLTVMARMKPGMTLAQANADVGAGSSTILHEMIPDANWVANREKLHFRFIAESGSAGFTYIRGYFSKPLIAVFAMCGGVLLLACLNLASLLMARGAARKKELATRLAMGAGRWRLVQQLLVESFLISVTGTIAGLAIAPLVSQSLTRLLLSGQSETHVDTSLDLRVFAFAALVAVAVSLLIGLVPALRATSGSLNEQMKYGQHSTLSYERRGVLPRVVMAAEVGLALTLVVGAGLLATTVVRLYRSGTGFDPRGVVNIAFTMDQQPLKGDALIEFYRQVRDGLAHQSGVKDVSFAFIIPFGHVQWDEYASAPGGKEYDIYENSISPGYFQTMRIPLLGGRDFLWNDTGSSGLKIILNQTAARLLAPDRNPLGQTIIKHNGDKTVQYEVVGVVADAKYESVRLPAPPAAYYPMTQNEADVAESYSAVVRTEGAAEPLVNTAHALAAPTLPELPMPVMTSMEEMVRDSMSVERMMALLSVFFAVCALMVTAVGLYGTLAYATARRTSEIGIRMALGAQRTQVAKMVFLQNASVAIAGTAAGIIAALLASRALASFLYGISTRDPWVFAGSIFVLALIASAASLLPALRAAAIQPMEAIRCE